MYATKHVRKLGNTLLPLNYYLELNGNPVNLAAYTVKIRIEQEDGTVIVNDSSSNVTSHPTQTFTLDSTNNWIACNVHGFEVGQVWVPSTSGSLSGTGLTAATRYKIVETDIDWFRVSVRSQGSPVTIAGAGSGTHSGYIVGSLQYDLQNGDVDAAGFFRTWVILESGGEQHHWPGKGHCQLEIEAVGN